MAFGGWEDELRSHYQPLPIIAPAPWRSYPYQLVAGDP
jgi:hypothetical protein